MMWGYEGSYGKFVVLNMTACEARILRRILDERIDSGRLSKGDLEIAQSCSSCIASALDKRDKMQEKE